MDTVSQLQRLLLIHCRKAPSTLLNLHTLSYFSLHLPAKKIIVNHKKSFHVLNLKDCIFEPDYVLPSSPITGVIVCQSSLRHWLERFTSQPASTNLKLQLVYATKHKSRRRICSASANFKMTFLHGLTVYVLIPYAVTTLTLFALSEFLPPAYQRLPGFFARALAYIFGLIVCATYGTIASIGLNLVGMSGLSQWTTAKAFKWVMWPLLQVWFDVEDESGASLTRPAVFLGNHQTEMDILFLGHIWPKFTSVTAKSNLKYYPFLGQFSKSI